MAALKPTPYQLVPLTKLLSNGMNALLICDGVGVGKTISAGYILKYLTRHCGLPALVVCPPGLQEKWQLELRDKFELQTVPIRTKEELHFAVDDWDEAGGRARIYIMSSSLIPGVGKHSFRGPIVLDEIHNYRNRETKIWQAAQSLARKASYRIGLSATPINNSIDDLAAELSILLNLSVDVCDAVVYDLWRPEKQQIIYALMTRFSKEKLRIHFARRRVHDIGIEFPDEYISQVTSGIKSLRSRPAGEKIFRDEITYFRLGASSPKAFRDSTKIPVLETTAKKDALNAILEQHISAPVIVFCEFEATATDISNSIGRPSFVITGSVPVFERDAILDQFRRSPDGVLILTSVGAEGLDLQFCSILVNFDLTWNPMVLEQRIGRIDRIGQEKSEIHIYNLVVESSIDVRIIRTLGRKLGLIEGSILEPNTVLASLPSRGVEINEQAADFEQELGKARAVAQALELATNIIPDDYELADALPPELCNPRQIELRAASNSNWAQDVAPAYWQKKNSELAQALVATIRHYST